MGKRGSKHAQVATLSGNITSGVDYASAPTAVPAGYAMDMYNMYYPDQTTAPATRPGTSLVYWDETDEDDPIDAMFIWQKNATTAYTIVAQGNKLYYLSAGALVEIGALSAGITPCFASFNQLLIIADKASGGLRSWDGTTYGFISGSPTYPAACVSHSARLWCNSMASGSSLDIVYGSAVEDEENWDTAYGAVSIPTEYGSGLYVAGFASFGSDLIVFKRGTAGKKQTFRLNTAGESSAWSAALVSSLSSSVNHMTAASLGTSDVIFADTDGVKSISGTEKYGDFTVFPDVGMRVAPRMSGGARALIPLPPASGILLLVTDSPTCFLFHPHNGAWCPLEFACGTITAACADSSQVFLGDASGRIWKIDSSVATDAFINASTQEGAQVIHSYTHTPLQSSPYGMILRRLNILAQSLSAGAGRVFVVSSDLVGQTKVADWDFTSDSPEIYGNTDEIFGNTDLIFSSSEHHIRSRARHRAESLSVKIESTEGRIRINQLTYEIAHVNA